MSSLVPVAESTRTLSCEYLAQFLIAVGSLALSPRVQYSKGNTNVTPTLAP
jgi:hypothetical protein